MTSVYIERNSAASRFDSNDSWTILSPIEQSIKRKIEAVGIPLKKWDVNIYRGVLTGYNDAFIISGKKKDELIAADPKSAEIIRPILRGRDIKRYHYEFADLWLIDTHNGIREKGIPPVNVNGYPAIKAHLNQFYDALEKRLDKGDTPYNLRSCAYTDDFSKQKIVWAELARTGNAFTIDTLHSIVLNTSYVLTSSSDDINELKYLSGMLNSMTTMFYMNLISSKFDQTGWRWLKQFVERLPIPKLSYNEQQPFIKMVDEILDLKRKHLDTTTLERDLDKMIYRLFDFSDEEIQAIEA
ncbi:MAG: class I SAM-dependent DNA methyltransferase [Chloroflexi bacterium]|nr:class I SAM-dependent DNA methyltransferase [Chloroflexota bacterium]